MPKKPNAELAREIWNGTVDIKDTVTHRYLVSRGITTLDFDDVRHHPNQKHFASGRCFPAMVAAVRKWPNTTITGIQITYLMPDGSGKADVEPQRISLGEIGGGGVQLRKPTESNLGVAEGIETALSVVQTIALPTWAVLSAVNYKKLDIPETIEKVLVATDNDENGTGLKAARKALEDADEK
mgnify:FL=1